MKPHTAWSPRLASALLAGAIAIIVNTAALKAAELVPLATAKGGLLRLLITGLALPRQLIKQATGWDLPITSPGPMFQTGFHLLVGIAMALFYAFAVEPRLRGGAWRKGALYGLVVWLFNALLVLPLTGEGLAGSAHLTAAGMLWYGAAHTVFFLLLAVVFAQLMRYGDDLRNTARRVPGA